MCKSVLLIALDTLRRVRRRRHLSVLLLVALGVAAGLGAVEFFGSGRYQQVFFHIMMLVLPLLSAAAAVLSTFWILPQQIADRTLLLMLARPVRRGAVVVGVFAGAGAMSLLAYLVFSGLFLAALAWRHVEFPPALLHALTLLAVQVLFFTALALLLSLLTTPAMAATICLLYYFIGQVIQPALQPVLAQSPWAARLPAWVLLSATPHLNYFNLTVPVVHLWPAVSWLSLAPTIAYGLGWTALLVVLASWRFARCEL